MSEANSFAIDDALAGLRSAAEPVVEQRARAVHEQAGRVDGGRHVGEHELQALEVGDLAAELLALLHVAGREVERALRDTERLRADERPGTVERAHRVREPLALLADQVLGRHHALVEHDLARG